MVLDTDIGQGQHIQFLNDNGSSSLVFWKRSYLMTSLNHNLLQIRESANFDWKPQNLVKTVDFGENCKFHENPWISLKFVFFGENPLKISGFARNDNPQNLVQIGLSPLQIVTFRERGGAKVKFNGVNYAYFCAKGFLFLKGWLNFENGHFLTINTLLTQFRNLLTEFYTFSCHSITYK